MIRVLEVQWKGGCSIRESDVKARVLGPPGAHAFEHRARVWKEEDGRLRGVWWDDGRPLGEASPPDMPPREGRWVPFVTPYILPALWDLAQSKGVEVPAKRAA